MGLLFLAFVLLPLADLWLLIRIGGVVGGLNVLTYTLALGVLGSVLVRSQGQKVLGEWRNAQATGRVPEEGVVGGLLVLLGGLLLISPGVITDVLGFCCLFPPTRRAIARLMAQALARKIAEGQLRVSVSDTGFAWPPRPPAASGFTQPGSPRVPRDAGAGSRNQPHDPRMQRPEDVIDTEGEEL